MMSATALFLITLAPATAVEMALPTGTEILEVNGSITSSNADGKAIFDLEMLDTLPQRVTKAITPWYTGEREFSGVIISDLLEYLGASGDNVTFTALNDYAAEIPMEELENLPIILATRVDGQELSVRDKGPLFVIYPFDLDSALYNEVIFGRSVWQVASVTVH
ncbi:molybdopterin-dependent oxidoreductase [Devosia riboflavina]|nr:molybdopterin-dependent oxidoreductase [Devosia riboflavina]